MGIGARNIVSVTGITDGWYSKFNGLIDGTRIYNRAINQAEISALYSQGVQQQSVNLTNGLVAHYEFEGNANDSSGNGNNGVEYGGVIYEAGIRGQGLSLHGDVNQYIDDGQNLKKPFPMTVSSWVRFDSFPTANVNPIFLNDSVNGYDYYHGIYVYVNTDGRLAGFVGSGIAAPSSRKTKISSESVITAGKWHQISVVFNDYNDIQLFKDGVEVSGEFGSGTGSGMTYSSVYTGRIGTTNHSDEQYRASTEGMIDEVRVYERALSTSEIGELFSLESEQLLINH